MFATSTCHSTENPSQRSQARKRHKRHTNWRGRSEMIFAHTHTHKHTHKVENPQSPNSNSLNVCHTTENMSIPY